MTVDTANLRAGPGTDFALAGIVTTGQTLAIVGRDRDGELAAVGRRNLDFHRPGGGEGEPPATPTALPPTPAVSLLYTAPEPASSGRWSTPPASTCVPHPGTTAEVVGGLTQGQCVEVVGLQPGVAAGAAGGRRQWVVLEGMFGVGGRLPRA